MHITSWLHELRAHQWLKNLLLFVPAFAAHQFTDCNAWQTLVQAFCAFSLCASSVYIINNLFDLESDKQHPRKCNRLFASGKAPLWQGAASAAFLLCISLVLAAYVNGEFMSWLMLYFLLSSAYSWRLKRFILIDCLLLAFLYTLRVIAGAVSANVALSFWLLAFSVFLFLSLAFVKRYVELDMQLPDKSLKAYGRGYVLADAPLIQMMGIVSGYAATLILALYINSDAVVRLYRTPEIIWGNVLVMLFWINWVWMQTNRGHMHEDPLIFALTDKASLLSGLVFVSVLAIGANGWPL